jgi:MoaA/NifB/PqqE/SkfB family radical SAM enzyme
MKNKIDVKQIDIEHIKKHSLCSLPWLHIHVTPDQNIMPCCIANMENVDDVRSTKDDGIMDWMNSDAMKKMRLDMLNGIQPNACKTCYHQETSMESFRKTALREYSEFMDEEIANTNEDGSIDEFKMRYLDMRFSNLCNMKCRTCGSAYSSQWEIEDAKYGHHFNEPINEINKPVVFEEVKDQIPNLKKAYFAGGEPLITEDHYILLEEMIRKGKTDIFLSYNTNISKLYYKDKDLMNLWRQFKHRVQVYASLDHYGAKAEYIRHGTKWDEVLENYKTLWESDDCQLNITTSVSLFNWPTLTDFIEEFNSNGIAPWTKNNKGAWQINPIYGPEEFSFQALPEDFKDEIIDQQMTYMHKLKKLTRVTENRNFVHQIELLMSQLQSLGKLAKAKSNWEEKKNKFRTEVRKIDGRRGEDFATTFPELARLIHEE